MSREDIETADHDNARAVRPNLGGWDTRTPGRIAYLNSPEGRAETARQEELYQAALAEKMVAKRARDEKARIERNAKARAARKGK